MAIQSGTESTVPCTNNQPAIEIPFVYTNSGTLKLEVTARVPPCWCRAHGHAKFENTAREHVLLACFRKL